NEIKKLKGLLPICSNCKKIRKDDGYWEVIETYISEHSEADFSHSVCPECVRKLYPEHAETILKNIEEKENNSV
ncbi:MAG: response regulator, partial [Candidatus Anammoxibacter sp.]